MFLLIAVLLLVSIAIYYFVFFDYIETIDYSIENKYGNYYTANKDTMIKEIVSDDETVIYDYYSDFVVIYLKQPNDRYRFSRIQFCTDAYVFGIGRITVGTSKTTVEKLMKHTKRCGNSDSYMCDDNGRLLKMTAYCYTDKSLEYVFAVAYDEEDKVRYISISSCGLL